MKDIVKKLKIAQYAISSDWDLYRKLHGQIADRKLNWIDIKYSNQEENDTKNARKDSLDFGKFWSTYAGCIQMRLDDKMIVRVICWNGNVLNGFPKEKRWEGYIQLKESHLNYFESSIERYFNEKIQFTLERIEKQERLARLKLIEMELLNEIEP